MTQPPEMEPIMARDIDQLIDYIADEDTLRISPVLRQVLINRVNPHPTSAEVELAHADLEEAVRFARDQILNEREQAVYQHLRDDIAAVHEQVEDAHPSQCGDCAAGMRVIADSVHAHIMGLNV